MNFIQLNINKYIKIRLINNQIIKGVLKYFNMFNKIICLEKNNKIIVINIDKISLMKIIESKNIMLKKFNRNNNINNLIKNNVELIPLTNNNNIINLFEKLYKIFPNDTKWSGKCLNFANITWEPPYIYDRSKSIIKNNYLWQIFEKYYIEIFQN